MIVGLSGVEEEDDGDADDDDGEEAVGNDKDDDGEKAVGNDEDDVSLTFIAPFDSISQLETTTNDVHRFISLLSLRYPVERLHSSTSWRIIDYIVSLSVRHLQTASLSRNIRQRQGYFLNKRTFHTRTFHSRTF